MKKQNAIEVLSMREEEWMEPDWQREADRDWLSEMQGKMPYRMMNPYLFRLLMQRKPRVLKSFLRLVLAVPDTTVLTVRIQNPIAMGERIVGKKSSMVLWVRASGLWEGTVKLRLDAESEGRELLHISFRRTERRESEIGLDLVQLQTMDLRQIAAKGEETSLNLPGFARLFIAENWEELKDISQFSEVLREASQAIAELLQMEKVRILCMEREVASVVSRWKNMQSTKEKRNNLSYCQSLLQQQNDLLVIQQKVLGVRL